ncbi:MAG: hypothetical protein Q9181_000458 [Wetmoreana brouardii]
MVVRTIYVTRHAFRVSYTLNAATGEYRTNSPSPTGIPSDPPLASYGVQQSHELAEALTRLDPAIDIVEWYGVANFNHPSPASPALLKTLFPFTFDEIYQATVIPQPSGETISQLHDRVAYALDQIIASIDAESVTRDVSILICTHAAILIAIGRTLTGSMPSDPNEDDFIAPTAGITKFVRRQASAPDITNQPDGKVAAHIRPVDWKNGQGVAGGWTCVLNGNCDHLAGGAERSWGFKDAE